MYIKTTFNSQSVGVFTKLPHRLKSTLLQDVLSAVEILVQYANVPWSEKVSQLVDRILLMKHQRVVNIELEKRRIPQKLILQKYFTNINNVDTEDVWPFPHISCLVYVIFPNSFVVGYSETMCFILSD